MMMSDYMKNQGLVDGITGCRNRQRELAKDNKRYEAEIERLKRMRDMWKATANSNRDEIERLKAALAESCDENRTVVLEEGPFSTDMCPLAGRQQAEIERLTKGWEGLEYEASAQITSLAAAVNTMHKEIERLRAVVDAAKEVIQDEQVYENGTTYSLMKMEKALAAQEDDDE
jgi:outer membrane murein-binding lipoprotein Lpp